MDNAWGAIPLVLIVLLAGYAFLASWPPPKRQPEEDSDDEFHRRFEQ